MKIADLQLRSATLDDAAIVADIYTETHPDDPEDPKLQRHWWSMVDPDATVERFIALRDGKFAGYAMWQHPSWKKMPERYVRVNAELRTELQTAERANALFDMLEAKAKADGALKATAWTWEYDAFRLDLLTSRGYKEERRSRFWQLDLVEGKERIAKMAAESRERMKREHIQVLTLGEDNDPKKFEKLKRMSDEAEQDVPTTVPHVPAEMDEWMKWFSSPGLRPDRIWIAREGDDIVGISMLAYPPVRGIVSTDWTGTARKVRGRGVARALKCETLMQAIALGIDRVRTDNDSANVPILHINESMGYRRRPDMIQFLKVL
jgi:GNAT superfamily N-acetyltransferase